MWSTRVQIQALPVHRVALSQWSLTSEAQFPHRQDRVMVLIPMR